jgi:uncharacterized protein YjbI with pentapeptide repeats
VDLSSARLEDADLRNARLSGADLSRAGLEGTFLAINQPPPDVLPAA